VLRKMCDPKTEETRCVCVMMSSIHQIFLGDQVKEDELGGDACRNW
jgi:hypothetical protein